ncbi:MAG: hypothetical protein E7409_07925 [Ruminococcaceae bacterium]|nr:hypothetical protein [Oscillospiraceae bacterium]
MRNKTLIRVLAWIALIAFLAISVLVITPFPSAQASAQSKINNAQQKQNEMQDKINQSKQKQKVEMSKKNEIDAQITEVQKEINVLDDQLDQSNQKLAAKEQELATAEAQSQAQYDNYVNRVKIMVQKGSLTYLDILLNATSFSDFLTRMDVITWVAEYDSNLLNILKEHEDKIRVIKDEMQAERDKIATLLAQSNEKKKTLNAKRAESQSIIDALQADVNKFQKEYEKAKQQEAAARAEIAGLTRGSNTKFVGGKFMWPSNASTTITSPYGMRFHPTLKVNKLHTGIDIGAGHGTAILAANDGKVIKAGWGGGYGNYIVIDHGGGYSTLYAHASSLSVSAGQQVKRGQTIGKVGSTGFSTGPHLHFEVLINGQCTNPIPYVQG